MELSTASAILSGLFALAFYLAILRDALHRVPKPNPVSWFIWAFNDTLILLASLAAGARNTLIVPIVYTILGWGIVFICSKNQRAPLTKVEISCLIGAAISWLAFFFVGALTALIIAVLVNTLGAVPSIVRLWVNPAAESIRSWRLVWLSAFFSFISLEQYTAELLLFPSGSLILNTVMVLLILRKPGHLR